MYLVGFKIKQQKQQQQQAPFMRSRLMELKKQKLEQFKVYVT